MKPLATVNPLLRPPALDPGLRLAARRMRLRAQSNGWDPRAIEAAVGFLDLFLQLIRPKLLIRRSIIRGGAMPLGDLSSSVLRQYPKAPTGNPGVVRRMQIPEESDTAEPKAPESKAHDPKASEPKASEPKVKGSNRQRRLMSAEPDASTLTQRTPRDKRFLNRELSRIDFNDRVLALA